MKVDKTKWEKKTLGEVCEIINGDRGKSYPSKSKLSVNGLYPFISAANLKDFSVSDDQLLYLSEKQYEALSNGKIRKEDIALCIRGSLGKFGFFPYEQGAIASSLVILRGKRKIRQGFIGYYLRSNCFTEQVEFNNNGVAQPNLSAKKLSEFKINVPSINIQQAIASELDAVQAMIDGYRQQIADLDALAQSIFLDTFGDPITNQKGWKTSMYDYLFNISSGGTPSKKISDYWTNGNIPWIGSNMCTNSILYKTDGKTITKLGLENSSAKIFPVETIIVALVGATIGKCGLLAIPTSTNQNIAGLNIKDRKILHPTFAFFHTIFLYPLFKDIGDGKFTISNQGFIKKLPIRIPPLPLQHHFASQVESIEKQKELLRQQLADAETLMAERMQYYFS